jgi:iron complex transport system permease protein
MNGPGLSKAQAASRCDPAHDLAADWRRLLDDQRRTHRRRWWWLAGLSVLAVAGLLASLGWGPSGFDIGQLLSGLLGREATSTAMIRAMRLPRLAMGLLAGLGLGLAGCLAQAVLRNPLASPFTLGISSGGAFGAAAAMLLWPAKALAVPALAILFSLLTASVSLGVSRIRGAATETLILAGVAIMFLFSALTSFIQYMAPQMDLHRIVFWSFGSLSKADWPEIGVAALLIVPTVPWLLRRAPDLDLLVCGDETAASLGVDTARLRRTSIAIMSAITAGAICFCGVIGFIGLVAPHMARLAVGGQHRLLLPASGLLGMALVILADLAGRTFLAPLVIPVGIMTAFLGVPFFFWLLVRHCRRLA